MSPIRGDALGLTAASRHLIVMRRGVTVRWLARSASRQQNRSLDYGSLVSAVRRQAFQLSVERLRPARFEAEFANLVLTGGSS